MCRWAGGVLAEQCGARAGIQSYTVHAYDFAVSDVPLIPQQYAAITRPAHLELALRVHLEPLGNGTHITADAARCLCARTSLLSHTPSPLASP